MYIKNEQNLYLSSIKTLEKGKFFEVAFVWLSERKLEELIRPIPTINHEFKQKILEFYAKINQTIQQSDLALIKVEFGHSPIEGTKKCELCLNPKSKMMLLIEQEAKKIKEFVCLMEKNEDLIKEFHQICFSNTNYSIQYSWNTLNNFKNSIKKHQENYLTLLSSSWQETNFKNSSDIDIGFVIYVKENGKEGFLKRELTNSYKEKNYLAEQLNQAKIFSSETDVLNALPDKLKSDPKNSFHILKLNLDLLIQEKDFKISNKINPQLEFLWGVQEKKNLETKKEQRLLLDFLSQKNLMAEFEQFRENKTKARMKL